MELFDDLPQAVTSGPVIRYRSAEFSKCRRYRWTLTRAWDSRPTLLVLMFNPSNANEHAEDPTIRLVCHIADHNGFGGIVVVNMAPIVSSTPAAAVRMLQWDQYGPEWGDRDLLQHNLAIIETKASAAGAILLGCGALAAHDEAWFDYVVETVEGALPDGAEVYCLGKTAAGYPLHPLARGKLKVRRDAKLLPWGVPA
jgi:hypothetical protein